MMAGCCIIVCRKGTAESEEEFKGGCNGKRGDWRVEWLTRFVG